MPRLRLCFLAVLVYRKSQKVSASYCIPFQHSSGKNQPVGGFRPPPPPSLFRVKPNGGIYLQLITAKGLYIQNITVAEHDGHSDSFQVKFPNVFTNYPLGAVRVEDQKFKDWDHYKFTLWQSQMNFVVFCASSACGVFVEHLNAKEPMINSIYRFHVTITSEGY